MRLDEEIVKRARGRIEAIKRQTEQLERDAHVLDLRPTRRGSEFSEAPGPEWCKTGCKAHHEDPAQDGCFGCRGWGYECEGVYVRREPTRKELEERHGLVSRRLRRNGRERVWELVLRERPPRDTDAMTLCEHAPFGGRVEIEARTETTVTLRVAIYTD